MIDTTSMRLLYVAVFFAGTLAIYSSWVVHLHEGKARRLEELEAELQKDKEELATLRDRVTCPVCLEQFHSRGTLACRIVPRLLGCGHTACEGCLRAICNPLPPGPQSSGKFKALECPVCRKQCKVPSGDVGNLPLVYAMLGGR
eukprot:SAG22_NODE_2572_length_2426_cov_1.275032_2_plen_144_part_00